MKKEQAYWTILYSLLVLDAFLAELKKLNGLLAA